MSTDLRSDLVSLFESIKSIEHSIAEKNEIYLNELEKQKSLTETYNQYHNDFDRINAEIKKNRKICCQILQEISSVKRDYSFRNNYNTNGFSLYNTCDTRSAESCQETIQQKYITQYTQQHRIPCYIPCYVELQFDSLLRYLKSNRLTHYITFSTESRQIDLVRLKEFYRNSFTLMIVQMTCGNMFGIFFNNTTKSLFKIISPVPYEYGIINVPYEYGLTTVPNKQDSYLQVTNEYIDYSFLKICFNGVIEFNFNPMTKICVEPYMDYFSLYSVN
ncbi:hypothetical protein EDI_295290 [Entamoeba dispar SAW760]|uniref:Uncharacterized protein n=1 Tax=Entamoeba dispar (strain ATCC PRA-260 / SAW760) TaxID=370354 RepID=B0EI98_ENTDS|nr:uncharacterized protein EDI_295290 [Entamoeba dispar SAW760]EDR25746.1 hypothetical protein EDI_295290 [Entamoeba dispar SAW760]|eukprot:EDR25746.1 hypothetical protein EDI_295290 [Entamoeba dispar SAW760]